MLVIYYTEPNVKINEFDSHDVFLTQLSAPPLPLDPSRDQLLDIRNVIMLLVNGMS